MRTLQILMPMGGLGSRFAKAGYSTPKPLIEVDGQPMFLKAISSFDHVAAPKTFTFVIRQKHVDEHSLENLIKEALPEAQVVIIPELTRGAAETALQAYPQLNPDDGLVVMDCDAYFKSAEYDQLIEKVLSEDHIDGGLLTFTSSNPRYSYAEVDETGNVIRTAEKNPICDRALIGAYFFGKSENFKKAADELMKESISDAVPEYYMSLVYNYILGAGGTVMAARSEVFDSFGTPEELAKYQNQAHA